MNSLHAIRRWALLLCPLACAVIAPAAPPDPRLLSLVPPNSQLLAGITAPSGERIFLLMIHGNEVDFHDFLALSGVDDTKLIQQVVLVAAPGSAGRDEHSLLAGGHFDQARIFNAAIQNGAVESEYRGIRILVLQPFTRELANFKDVRWLAILDARLALFGTIASVREELDRHLDGASMDRSLSARLARLRHDDLSWCVVQRFVLNGEALRAVSRLNDALADQIEEGDSFQFGIRFGRRVRFEYELARAAGAPPAHPILAALARSIMGEAIKESSLLSASDTAGDSGSERGAVEISRPRYETWLDEVLARAQP